MMSSMSGYSFKQAYRYTSIFRMIGRAQPSDELRAKTRTAGETREYKASHSEVTGTSSVLAKFV